MLSAFAAAARASHTCLTAFGLARENTPRVFICPCVFPRKSICFFLNAYKNRGGTVEVFWGLEHVAGWLLVKVANVWGFGSKQLRGVNIFEIYEQRGGEGYWAISGAYVQSCKLFWVVFLAL